MTFPGETCRHCGEAIQYNVTWPGGKAKWQARIRVYGWWSFCPAVDGAPHEPVNDVSPEPNQSANITTPDDKAHCEVGHHPVTQTTYRPPVPCWDEAFTVVPLYPSEASIVVCEKHAAMLPVPTREVDQ